MEKGMKRATAQVQGHAPIHLLLHESSVLSADWLVRYFARQLEDGARFEFGQTVQVGASLILLRAEQEGLVAMEPTYVLMPIAWTPGVTRTLRDLTLQSGVCEALSVEPAFASVLQSLVAQKGYESAKRLVFERDTPPAGNASGWLVRSPERGAVEAGLVSIYEALVHQPQLAPFLALPAGASVSISQTHIGVTLDGRRVSSEDSTLLAGLLTRGQ